MKVMKRAKTVILRQKGKNILLFGLVFVLITLLAGAISIHQAIANTETALLLQTPTVSTLGLNRQAAAEELDLAAAELPLQLWQENLPTIEDIIAVGQLPYVRAYDFVMNMTLASTELNLPDLETALEDIPQSILAAMSLEINGFAEFGGQVEKFPVKGVANPDLTHIEAGLIQLIGGRTFTQAEIDQGAEAAIISNTFANANNLDVGDRFIMENKVFNEAAMVQENIFSFIQHWHEERFIHAWETLELEVVGIFETTGFEPGSHTGMELLPAASQYIRLHHQVYAPISLVEAGLAFQSAGRLEIADDLIATSADITMEDLERDPAIQSLFMLYDPRDLPAFQETANELLPGFWEVADMMGIHGNAISSMEIMEQIANMILLTAIGAAIIILGLLITLFLKERRSEIGLYLALGERKHRVITQLLAEILAISAAAIIAGLLTGNLLSGTLSRQMLESHLVEAAASDNTRTMDDGNAIPWELAIFNPGQLSMEDTLALFDTGLTPNTAATILVFGTAVVTLSTLTPMLYILKLQPKKILL